MRTFAVLLLPPILLAQGPVDERELLARADASLFTARTVRLAATQSTSFAGAASVPPGNPFKMEFVRGGRGRVEYFAGNTTVSLFLFDGADQWEYRQFGNTYSKRPASAWTFQGEIATLAYGRNPANISAASYEREETIDFGGRPVPCYVVRADYRGAPENRMGKGVVRRVRISKDAELILRDSWEGPLRAAGPPLNITTNYTVIETDIPLADDLFVFHPPSGSKPGELSVPGGLAGGALAAAPPPPPPPKKLENKPEPPRRINVDAGVQQAKLLRQSPPVYPPLAKRGRIQGVVRLRVIISRDGTIQDLHVISGPQLLVQAAVDAVKLWVYQPTTFQGEPAEVITQVDVPFRLDSAQKEF